MLLTQEQHGKYIVIAANGRLDATWADYFADTCLDHIRNGHHNLILDAQELSFLSSAGIRSLLRINKELLSVKGSFLIVNSAPFVAKTIEMTGFKQWLSEQLPEEISTQKTNQLHSEVEKTETYVLNPSAMLTLSVVANWQPWQSLTPDKTYKLSFPNSVFALGIGSASDNFDEAKLSFGEFIAVGSHVIFQPPEVKSRPDYLIAEMDYIPEMIVIQALCCQGEMSHLFRFSPEENILSFTTSEIIERVFSTTKSNSIAFVVLAEVDGLVGATLIQTPGQKSEKDSIPFPEIREWLSFCGDRLFPGHQALVFGIATRNESDVNHSLLRPLPACPEISGHFHAAVFPFQPLQNGKIDLIKNVQKFLNGPPPQALLHLIDDDRPIVGLGQSSFIRGACWCAPLQNMEGLV